MTLGDEFAALAMQRHKVTELEAKLTLYHTLEDG
jgi:hypothetical protein